VSSAAPAVAPGRDPYRWTILGVGSFAQLTAFCVLGGVVVLAPALQDRYDLSLAETGPLIGSVSLGQLATLVVWGLAADRLGERVTASTGLGAAAVALAGAAYAPSYAVLLLCLVAAGAASSSLQSATGRAVMAWFGPEERGLALGLRQASLPIGGFLVALVLPPVVAAGGVKAALLLTAAVTALGAVVAAVGLRDRRRDAVPAAPVGQGLTHPFKDPTVWRLATAGGVTVIAQLGLTGFLVLFLHEARGFSLGAAAAVLAAANALGMVARIGVGRWSDLRRNRVGPLRRLTLASAIGLLTVAVLVDAPHWALLPALAAAGAVSMSWNGLAFTATAERAGPERSGAALGLQQSLLAASAVLTPLAFAPLVDATSWGIGFALLALSPLAGFVLLRRV
jgi:sugar phosphate permease